MQKNTPCSFHAAGRCTRYNCPFLHDKGNVKPKNPERNPMHSECSFFRAGTCTRGSNCPFIHSTTEQTYDTTEQTYDTTEQTYDSTEQTYDSTEQTYDSIEHDITELVDSSTELFILNPLDLEKCSETQSEQDYINNLFANLCFEPIEYPLGGPEYYINH